LDLELEVLNEPRDARDEAEFALARIRPGPSLDGDEILRISADRSAASFDLVACLKLVENELTLEEIFEIKDGALVGAGT
jgi:hypothetical protein